MFFLPHKLPKIDETWKEWRRSTDGLENWSLEDETEALPDKIYWGIAVTRTLIFQSYILL